MSSSRENSDVFKGLAIILVVAGHNYFVVRDNPSVFSVLYSFHVFLFFLIIGTRPETIRSFHSSMDVVARYYVPFLIFTVFFFFLFTFSAREEGMSLQAGYDLLIALFIGSAPKLDVATGFQLLWFLPALVAVRIFRIGYSASGRRPMLKVIALIAHVSAGLVPAEASAWIPFGLFPAAFVFFFVILARDLAIVSDRHPKAVTLGSFVGLVFVSWVIVVHKARVNVALGQVYGIDNGVLLLVTDLSMIFGFLFVYGLSQWSFPKGWLRVIGKSSMIIFLTHQLVFQALWRVTEKLKLSPSFDDPFYVPLIWATITIAISIFAGLIFAALLKRLPTLERCIFPKGLSAWPLYAIPAQLSMIRKR